MVGINAWSLSPAGAGNSRVREGLIGFVILLAVALAAALAALALLARETGEPLIMGLLSLLAAIGVFAIFSLGVGLARFSDGGGDWFQDVYDKVSDRVIISGSDNLVVYTNQCLAGLFDGRMIASTGDIEAALSEIAADPAQVYRLFKAHQRGLDWDEDIRLAPHPIGATDDALSSGEIGSPARWLRVSLRHCTTAGSNPARNLTEWRLSALTPDRATSAAKDKETLLAALRDFPVAGLATDWSGRVIYANDALVAWSGIDPASEMMDKLSLTDLFTQPSVQVLRETIGATQDDAQGELSELSKLDVDVTMRDGKTAPATAHVRVLPEASDLAITILNEKSDTIATATADNEQELYFSRFFQAAPIAIATLEEDGRAVRANVAFNRMFAAKRRDGALDIFAAINDDTRETARKTIAAAVSGNANLAPVDIAIGKEAKQTGRLYASPITLSEPRRSGAIVYAIDTTKQRELESQFAQSQKMQAVGQLAGGMAHDFNNVLTTIILSSDFLLSSRRPTDPAFKDIMAIKQNASRAAGIVRQLLAFSRQQTLRPRVLTLTDVISDWSIWLSRILEENVELKVSHGRDLWYIKADQTQLEQVIMNLAVNARDAMAEGGRLTLRTYNMSERQSLGLAEQGVAPGEYVVCEVSDTGCGMSPDVIGKIFEPFFSTKEVGKGTGLGLATVYGIVKQTGGYINCDSTPGKGTTFNIYLPRYLEQPGEEAAAATTDKKERPRDMTGSGTVLLVEDEEAVRRFASRALTRQGYQVLEAGTGAEALEVMQEAGDTVDLVVSDIVMPEMDGPTLLKTLRKTNPELKIIFISGYAEDALKSLEEDEEFSFLPKPFQLKELVATVKEAIEK